MILSASVNFDALRNAFEWVSSSSASENEAFVSRITGKIHWSSDIDVLEDELPVDITDENIYVSVPHKNDLNLGRNLVLSFAEEHLTESYEAVSSFFRQRGAYRRFKDLLEQKGQLQSWYDFEAKAIEQALREWCAEQGLAIFSNADRNVS
jgi:hypothetical protein